MSFRTPLGKARGHGPAKDGTHHWWMQRVTAIALIPLVIWMVCAIITFPSIDMQNMTTVEMRGLYIDWFASPMNATMTILFIIAMFYHGALGMQVVLEDYVSNEKIKLLSIVIMKLLCFAAATAGIVSVISLLLRG